MASFAESVCYQHLLSSGCSDVAVDRRYRGEVSFHVASSRGAAISWIVKQFEGTGNVWDKRVNGSEQFCSSFA